jgi:hypothetical protein
MSVAAPALAAVSQSQRWNACNALRTVPPIRSDASPRNVNARAVMIGKIATGEIEDMTIDDGKNAAAVALGRMGGKARAAGMSAKRPIATLGDLARRRGCG